MKTSHEFAKWAEIIQKTHVTLFPFLAIFLDHTRLILNRSLFQGSVEIIIIVEALIDISKRIKSRGSWFDRLDNSTSVLLANGELFLSIDIICWDKIFFSLFKWMRLSFEVENILLLLRNWQDLFFIGSCFSLKAVF